jgi:hypothetical protein
MRKAGSLALALAALSAVPAQAQMTWTDQGFVNVSFGAQGGSDTLTTSSTFDLYGEQGSMATTQDVGGGGLFDLNAGYKVWRNLAVGAGYSRTGSNADAGITASVPDPDFFNRPRSLTGVSPDANHSENAFHIQATWVMPVTDKVDVAFSFGPTIFNVSQEIPTAITVNEPGPTLASTTIVEEKQTVVGINLGIDVNYFFTPRYGVGALARFTRASVDFEAADDSVAVGGFQIGAGLRVRF